MRTLACTFVLLLAVFQPVRAQRDSCQADTLCPMVALKTNLLFDLALAPNVEAELPLTPQWSVMGEAWFPWYVWHTNGRAYEVLTLGLEGRRWLGRREELPPLQGHFIGVYGAWSKYDLEWSDVGDQGELWSFGLTYGHSWRLAERLNLEASLSIGYLWGTRHHYHNEFQGEHLIWKYDATLRYFGPTKAKVSLVWKLPWRKKGGRP